jgi:hypothetical protein
MDESCSDQPAPPSRKRIRRNALKPNSAETDALREFCLVHTFCEKTTIEATSEDSLDIEAKPKKTCRLEGDDHASPAEFLASGVEIEELTSLPILPSSCASSEGAPTNSTTEGARKGSQADDQ